MNNSETVKLVQSFRQKLNEIKLVRFKDIEYNSRRDNNEQSFSALLSDSIVPLMKRCPDIVDSLIRNEYFTDDDLLEADAVASNILECSYKTGVLKFSTPYFGYTVDDKQINTCAKYGIKVEYKPTYHKITYTLQIR